MSTERTLPKSLHTVTVLVNVAWHLMQARPSWSHVRAAEEALCVLGLDKLSDTHGLLAAALKQLEAK